MICIIVAIAACSSKKVGGVAKEPYSDPEREGVYSVEPGNTFQYVFKNDPETQPIDIQDDEHAESQNEWYFRRHFREPLLRLLPTRYAPRANVLLLLAALIVMFTGVVITLGTQDVSFAVVGALGGAVVYGYPIAREVYRWRHRTVLIEKSSSGIRITYGEPDSFIFIFEGTGDGDSVRIEGSMGHTKKIGWPNKIFFWGCGDLFISGKIEGYAPTDIYNVPRIKKVINFLDGGD